MSDRQIGGGQAWLRDTYEKEFEEKNEVIVSFLFLNVCIFGI